MHMSCKNIAFTQRLYHYKIVQSPANAWRCEDTWMISITKTTSVMWKCWTVSLETRNDYVWIIHVQMFNIVLIFFCLFVSSKDAKNSHSVFYSFAIKDHTSWICNPFSGFFVSCLEIKHPILKISDMIWTILRRGLTLLLRSHLSWDDEDKPGTRQQPFQTVK